MKRFLTVLFVIILTASMILVGTGCKKTDKSAATEATSAETTAAQTTTVGATAAETTASSTGATNSSSSSGPSESEGKQVVINGAVNKTYIPARVEAANVGISSIVIYLYEKERGANGVTLQFPVDMQPGTYNVVDIWNNRGDAVLGEFFVLNGADEVRYSSTKGTLTLTAVGSKLSGKFQFTAVDSNDASKTIEVSGSFIDVPYNK